jgi:hypothetical protein
MPLLVVIIVFVVVVVVVAFLCRLINELLDCSVMHLWHPIIDVELGWYHIMHLEFMNTLHTYVYNLLIVHCFIVFLWWCSYDVFLYMIDYELFVYPYCLMHCFLMWIYSHLYLFVVCLTWLCDCEIAVTTGCWVTRFKLGEVSFWHLRMSHTVKYI